MRYREKFYLSTTEALSKGFEYKALYKATTTMCNYFKSLFPLWLRVGDVFWNFPGTRNHKSTMKLIC